MKLERADMPDILNLKATRNDNDRLTFYRHLSDIVMDDYHPGAWREMLMRYQIAKATQ